MISSAISTIVVVVRCPVGGQEPVLQRRLHLAQAVHVYPCLDEPPVNAGDELTRGSCGQGHGEPGAGQRRAGRDARLVDEQRCLGGSSAVDLYDHGARVPDQLADGALADDPSAVHDREQA
jgi:hypothetical protein